MTSPHDATMRTSPDAVFSLCAFAIVCSLRLTGQLAGAEVFHPPIRNVALKKPVTLEPADSICGLSQEQIFCKSTEDRRSVESCREETCSSLCPSRDTGKNPVDLFNTGKNLSSHIECVWVSDFLAPNGSTSYSVGFNGTGSEPCYVDVDFVPLLQIRLQSQTWSITFSTWIYSELGSSSGTLLDIADVDGKVLIRVFVAAGVVELQSGAVTSSSPTWRLPDEEWHHLALQIHSDSVSVFVDGRFLSPALHGLTLIPPAKASQYRVGQSFNGSDPFNGYLQDVRIYPSSFSNREIIKILSGQLPETRIQSSCKCPDDFPSITGDDETYCDKNPPVSEASAKYRLNDNSHPPEFVNDGKSSTFWVSAIDKGDVTLQIDLQDQFEVRKVQLVFYSPYPSVIRIERRVNATSPWQGWQYYSQSCRQHTGYPTNDNLTAAGDTNCKFIIEPNQDPKYTGGVIMFDLLEGRPGQGKNGAFSVDLRHFLLASAVRIKLEGHPYLPINEEKKHIYHGLTELKVEAVCNCFGHGVACDMATPYTCTCAPTSNTAGRNCNKCASGTFRANGRNDYAEDLCQQCECDTNGTVGASDACDPLGGQCVCKINTEGRQCDRCEAGYFNMTSSDPDGCQQCVCDAVGTVNASTTCDAVTGQCPCKDNVDGVHCDRCKVGYFNLTDDNLAGCTTCSCDVAGTSTTDPSCDLLTGQCTCKKYVTGLTCNQCINGSTHLTSSNPDGCESCGCDTNGSLSDSCDVITGQCDCRANVTGLKCDRCVDGRYALDGADLRQNGCQMVCNCSTSGADPNHLTTCDTFGGHCRCKVRVEGYDCDRCKPDAYAYGSSADEGCLACACDERGTVGGSVMCDSTSGQCACKRNVHSRACAACMAGSFGLMADNVDGCQLCDCYERGVILNSTCDPTNGQCQCIEDAGDLTKGGRQCMVYVETLSPSYGPRSGGTLITVTGGFLGNASNTTVLLTNSPCLVDPTRSSGTRVVCTSKPLTNGTLGQSLTATVTLSDGLTLTPNGSFAYKEDPVVNKVEPVNCILGGGIVLTVSGSHLDSVARPVMSITVYHKWTLKQQFLLDCSVANGDKMLCETPNFNLSSMSNRRRRDTDSGATYLAGSDLLFYIGFLLDGVVAYRNMSLVAPQYGLLRVYRNPEFTTFTEVMMYRPYWPYNDAHVIVKGNHLNRGATVNDYSVMIGRSSCSSLDLASNQISCIPPDTQPEPDASGLMQGAPGITVRVGNVVIVVGYMRYEQTFWDNKQLRNGVIGGVIGLVLVIILLVVCVVVWRRRRHRTRDDSHPHLEMNVKDNSKNPYISAYSNGSQSGYLTASIGGLLEILSPDLKERIGDVLILDPKRMVLGKLLGEGHYGRVHIGRLADEFHNHHMPVAIKTLRDRDITPRDISDFLEEAVMMKDFKDEHVLGLVGVAIEKNHPYVLLPYMENGDLKSFISNEENMLTVGELIDYGLQVAKGMNYLSQHHFVHRDLACRNCMVSKDLLVKIADFGLSRDIYEQDYYRDGDARRPLPVKWMALESLEEGKFTTKTDVWAFGILMWELQTRGCTPYPDVDAFDMKNYLLCGNRMDMPDFAPEEIYALMLRCWSEDPGDRPTFQEMFEDLETFLNMQNTKTQLRSRQRQHVPSSIRARKNFPSNGFV